MNISGIVVKTAPEYLEQVMDALSVSGLCEIHFHDETGKIIVTVEGTDTGEEVRKMREIMNLPHVLCVDLAYSYNESGLQDDLEQRERVRDAVPEALRCPPADV